MPVNTQAVAAHRPLRFNSGAEAMAEADRLAALDAQGKLSRLGNWTPGMIFAHVAAWASYPYEGFPAAIQGPPWFIRLIIPLIKSRFLKRGLPKGFRIRNVEGGTVGQEDVPTREGLARMRRAFERLHSTAPIYPSPGFGRQTHAECIQLNLRHAELHLGFLIESDTRA